MEHQQTEHRNTTGRDRKVRVETWLDRDQYEWLKTLAALEDRSMSSALRQLLRAHIQQALTKYETLRRPPVVNGAESLSLVKQAFLCESKPTLPPRLYLVGSFRIPSNQPPKPKLPNTPN